MNVGSPKRGVTASQARFANIPNVSIQRSAFDRSCGLKTTFDAGYLVPIFCDEALPGDTMSMQMTTFARLATPITAVMDNMFLDYFFFFVPNRLLWDNWEKFNGAQDNPSDPTDFEIPEMTSPAVVGYGENSLHDYLGLPTKIPDLTHNSLFHRAYNLIYNEWFRDENLVDSAVVPTDDGPDTFSDFPLRRRAKRHDYFTSCLPFPQKGTSVALPLGTTAPVIGVGGAPTFDVGTQTNVSLGVNVTNPVDVIWSAGSGSSDSTAIWNDTQLQTDLSTATAATINQIREAFQVQRLLEKDARGGTRYTEIVRAHFGVTSPDARLQRPEYLGGGVHTLRVNPVTATAFVAPTVGAKLGDVASVVTSTGTIGFNKSFTEHGVILGLVSMRADLNYQQGLDRMFSRSKRFDFYWPSLAHLGEQAVLNKEIFADGSANDELVFGYQERYAEYRYKPSKITGEFRSNATASLDYWHVAQEFGALPVLNESFIEENPPIERILTTGTTAPQVIFDGWFAYKSARPMPLFGVPGLIDHF